MAADAADARVRANVGWFRRRLDPAGNHGVDRIYRYPERLRHGLDDAELRGAGGGGGIAKDHNSRHTWRDLLEQLQPFPA